MRKIVILSYYILTLIPFSSALCDFGFEGNTAVSDRQLSNAIDPKSGTDDISEMIIILYRERGYFDATVRLENGDNSQTKIFSISEGRLSRISEIDIDISPDSLHVLLVDLQGNYKGRPASRQSFQNFAEESIRLLTEYGRPFARGEWTGFAPDENNDIIAYFKIIPGPRSIISNIEFDGINRTRPQTLKNAVLVEQGALFSRSEVLRSQELVGKLPYVEISSPYHLQASRDGDSVSVIYNVRELPSTRIEGFGGLINSGGQTDFIGRANFEFGDILGTGRMFGLFWYKKDAESSELSVKYVEPFIFGSRINLELEAFQVDRDTLFITTGGKASLVSRFGVDLTGTLYGSLERTVPESESIISRSIKRSFGVAFNYDKTDFNLNPEKGYEIGSELEYRYRANSVVMEGQNPPSNITAAGSRGVVYLSPLNKFVAAASIRGWGIVSSNGTIPADEYKYIGGANDLRGYTEEQFPAYRYVILGAEPRLLTGRYSRIYLFGDFGFIKKSQDSGDDYEFKPGYGLGLVSRIRIGLVKVEIGWGKQDFPDNAVFNFVIESRF